MKLSIDGKQIEVKGPKTLLEAAKENDISIPSLCDHPHLTPFSGCRLCLVKIKGRKGYMPSCSTYAEEGMEVQTQSPRLKKMRKQIMEFILSEHPNACLICREKENCDEYKSTIRKVGEVTGCVLCPNNGRCQLQDVVADLNIKRVSFPSRYRELEIKKRDPFFDQNYNLCILCGRCVRVCQKVRGNYVLTFINRGTQTVVGTVLDRPHVETGCQFCGACVDVCPTGALTERELKYEGLPDQSELTTCSLCGMGCELRINLKEGRMVNSPPSEKGAVNQGQACVKGRFTLKDVCYSEDRVLKPMIRRDKHLEEVEWDEALDYVAQRLRENQGEKAALFASTQLSCEDGYISQKFAREVLKTENVTTPVVFSPGLSLKKLAAENGMDLGLNYQMEQISQAQTVFLVGTDIPFTHPMVWLNVLKALQKGARFVYLSPYEFEINRHAHQWIRNKPGTESFVLQFLSRMILQNRESREGTKRNGFPAFKKSLKDIPLDNCTDWTGVSGDQLKKAARNFQEDLPAAILFGGAFSQVPWKNQNLSALWNLSLLTQADLFPLEPESNTRGMGVIHGGSLGPGQSFNRMVQNLSSGKIKALYQIGPVPLSQEIKTDFRVLQDSFRNSQSKKADALLPASTFLEEEGIFVNTEGRIQKANPVASPVGDSRPDWWILSQLAQRMGKTDFKYKSTSRVRRELRNTVPELSPASSSGLKEKELFLKEKEKGEKKYIPIQLKEIPIKPNRDYPYLMILEENQDYYRNFHLSEKIKGFRVLRNTHWLTLSPDDAEKLNLEEDQPVKVESEEGKINRIVKISTSVPPGTVKTRFHWDEPSKLWIDFDSSPVPSIRVLPVRIKRGE